MPEKTTLPTHIAIIMDGNGRWAAKRGLPRTAGHIAGVKALKKTVSASLEYGIPYLTVFAFGIDNRKRPEEEVSALMRLLIDSCRKELKKMLEDGVKVRFIGNRGNLAPKVKNSIEKTEFMTQNCEKLHLNIAFDYSGRDDILQAVNKAVANGVPLSEERFEGLLYTADTPAPDIILRTGGEKRISNFLLYQAAYSELIFSDKYWPDFNKKQFEKVLAEYAGRNRRFGGLSAEEQ